MRKKWFAGMVCAVISALVCGGASTQAAFEPTVEASYNTAVQGQDTLDGLDVSVLEKTVAAATNLSAEKNVELQVSGIKGNQLKAEIEVKTEEGSTKSYYQNGDYYTTTSEGETKREMERSEIWDRINAHIYLNLTSNYLKMLSSETNSDGTVTYTFAATQETLGDYSKKLLEGASEDQGLVIDSLQGTMQTDREGHVTNRSLQMVYTLTQGEQSETFFMKTDVEFHQIGEVTEVSLPDLSDYKEQKTEAPAETITPLTQTVYVTDDVNVRAAGNISAVILGGLYAGTGITETGYTSDGWIQVQYNDVVGYIWGDYVSTKRPVLTKNSSGTMYATATVNVRDTYSSDGAILGVLSKGSSVEITGTTDNGWIRVKYNGRTAYVYADYLDWSMPVPDNYVEKGYLSGTVTDASFGVLTILRDDGQGSATFNTTYAELNFKDTMYTGDWVEVYYSGTGAPYTAAVVNDYTSHSDAGEEQSFSVEGTIVTFFPDRMEVLCSDGLYRSFDISNCDFEGTGDLYEGKYVTVYWMSRKNGVETKNIEALRVMG